MELLIPCLDTLSGVLRKKRLFKLKYKDLASIAVLVGLSVEIELFENKRSKDKVASAVFFAPSLHL